MPRDGCQVGAARDGWGGPAVVREDVSGRLPRELEGFHQRADMDDIGSVDVIGGVGRRCQFVVKIQSDQQLGIVVQFDNGGRGGHHESDRQARVAHDK